MAYDKVVNSAALDAAMTATADAIRVKSGDDDAIAWDSSTGFADAIEAIPSDGSAITDGIVVTARDADGYAIEVDFYGSVLEPNQFFGGSDYSAIARTWKNLTKINTKNTVTQIRDFALGALPSWDASSGFDFAAVTTIGEKAFFYSKVDADIVLPRYSGGGGYTFAYAALTGITCDILEQVPNAMCDQCQSLMHVDMPSAKIIGVYSAICFRGCTALETATFGSVGHPVQSCQNDVFTQCNQSWLAITMYTTGAKVDTLLANIRNGATNATIIIKAAEDTAYTFDDGMSMSFAAGKTIITSTVEEAST